MGAADEDSDWDVVLVLLEGEPSQKKDGSVELITTTLERVKGVSSWESRGARALASAGQTGELAVAVEAAGRFYRRGARGALRQLPQRLLPLAEGAAAWPELATRGSSLRDRSGGSAIS